jgi:HK97 family phage prohead protease
MVQLRLTEDKHYMDKEFLNEKQYITTSFELDNYNQKELDNGMEFFTFNGYGSTFNNTDRHNEIMARGCFIESLKEHKPALLWQHDMRQPVGVFKECREDKKGLFVKGALPLEDTFVSGRVIPQIKAGSVNSLSIGFNVLGYEEDEKTGVLTWTKVKLWEISLVTIPANELAIITDYKKFDNDLENAESIRDIEKYLKNIGISNKKSAIIISKIKKYVRDEHIENNQCDIDTEAEKYFKNLLKLKMEV